jgi:hypothetical protein
VYHAGPVEMKKVEKAEIARANKVIHKGKNRAAAAYGSIRIDIIRVAIGSDVSSTDGRAGHGDGSRGDGTRKHEPQDGQA